MRVYADSDVSGERVIVRAKRTYVTIPSLLLEPTLPLMARSLICSDKAMSTCIAGIRLDAVMQVHMAFNCTSNQLRLLSRKQNKGNTLLRLNSRMRSSPNWLQPKVVTEVVAHWLFATRWMFQVATDCFCREAVIMACVMVAALAAAGCVISVRSEERQ